jgi:hypothetical protein
MRVVTTAMAALVAALLSGPAGAASVGTCGGSGGSQSITLSCPAGKYIVSVFARGASYVDRIGVRCAGFSSTGARGTLGAFQYGGGSGGTSSKSGTCSGDSAVVRIFTRAGIYLDRVRQTVCATRRAAGGFRAPGGKQFFFLDIGGSNFAGSECDLQCPDGEAMHRIIVRYGSWIDSIEAFCRP